MHLLQANMTDIFPNEAAPMNGAAPHTSSSQGDIAAFTVGLDLVRVRAIAESIAHFGQRFLERVYTPGELTYCMSNSSTAPMRLAARFAAKEAVMKVLRVADEAVSWRSIEVEKESNGACSVKLFDEARALADAAGFVRFSLSMTHESEYAGAVVIGERAPAARTS